MAYFDGRRVCCTSTSWFRATSEDTTLLGRSKGHSIGLAIGPSRRYVIAGAACAVSDSSADCSQMKLHAFNHQRLDVRVGDTCLGPLELETEGLSPRLR
jgi:hypothetical protein